MGANEGEAHLISLLYDAARQVRKSPESAVSSIRQVWQLFAAKLPLRAYGASRSRGGLRVGPACFQPPAARAAAPASCAFRDKLMVRKAEEGVDGDGSLATSRKRYRCVVVQAVPPQAPHPRICQANGSHD